MTDEEQKVIDDQKIEADKIAKENEKLKEEPKDLKSALAQKEHFRNKVEKEVKKTKKETEEKEVLIKELKELKEEVASKEKETTTQTTTETPNKDVDSLKEKIAKIEFTQKHPEIDAGDIEDVFQLAAMTSKTPEEVLEGNEMVKNHLAKKASDKKVANATPEGTRSGGVPHDKPISEMSEAEHKEWAEKVMGQ